jgi:hypothetical protein
MVAALPVLSWIGAAVIGTALFDKFLKPKVPFYKLQIDRLPHLRYMDGQWKTQLPTRVTLFNENYVSIDIYAVSFDLYYSDWWDGSLHHLARVEDRNQQVAIREDFEFLCTSASTNCTSSAIKRTPVWQILPRSDFDFQDDMYVVLSASLYELLTSYLFTMTSQLWKGSGQLVLPSTGVAHLQVGKIPATVALLCDNVVNTWAMAVEAFECQFQDIQLAWADLDETAEKTKQKALNWPLFPETGGFFLKEWTATADDQLDAFRIVTLENPDVVEKEMCRDKTTNGYVT